MIRLFISCFLIIMINSAYSQISKDSYGFFDSRDEYNEIYITKEYIYICYEPVPIIFKCRNKKESKYIYLLDCEDSHSTLEIRKSRKNGITIIINKESNRGYRIKERINIKDYYSNNWPTIHKFSQQLTKRKYFFLKQKE